MEISLDATILAKHLKLVQNASVLVIGDLILDQFIYGRGLKLSQEAPVPVVVVNNQNYSLGGAANVAANLRALGCKVDICAFIGEDDCGYRSTHMLLDAGIGNHLVASHTPTTCKTRIIANDQHIVRFDVEQKVQQQWPGYAKILDKLKLLKDNKYDAVIVSDYNKGVVTRQLVDFVKANYDGYLFADPKPSNFELFNGFHCITPNMKEANDFIDHDDLLFVAQKIKDSLNLTNLVITMSEQGVFVLDNNNKPHQIPVHVPHIDFERHYRIDVTGAGDTLIAVLSAAVASGLDIVNSLCLANIAAGIVVNKLGTSICSFDELMTEICIINGDTPNVGP